MGASTLLLWITTCYFRYLKYLPNLVLCYYLKYFWKPWKDMYKSMVSKEQEYSCLTQMKKKSFLLKANKYTNRFRVRRWKKPVVEMHCPLENSSQKKATDFIGLKIQRHFILTESLILSPLCLWSYLFVPLLNLLVVPVWVKLLQKRLRLPSWP